jgi:hypothetical protein
MARAIIVLGMHRSGTSCLAGMLEKAGTFFGDVSRENRHNAKGNFENKRIIKLHDDLLACNQGSWDDPPPHVEWPERMLAERDSIIAAYHHAPLWGFKDPRTLLALAGWQAALPDAVLVATFRHPLAVARSLERRNGFPPAWGLDLWTRYNRRLLDLYRRHPQASAIGGRITPLFSGEKPPWFDMVAGSFACTRPGPEVDRPGVRRTMSGAGLSFRTRFLRSVLAPPPAPFPGRAQGRGTVPRRGRGDLSAAGAAGRRAAL